MLRALAHKNYRLFFSGQSISLIGTWMTRIATSWLVYRLTGSPLLLGIVGFAGQIPSFILAPLAGVLVDRWKVMSFYTMAFMGTAPFGSLLAGSIAERIGAPHTLLFGGLGCIVGALWFASSLPALRRDVRPIYVKIGILPELATGIQHTSELTVPPEV